MTRNYPAEIEDQSNTLARLAARRDEMKETQEAITDEITREVLADVDETTGKPRHSNDKARELAIREQCRNSPAWVEADERAKLAEITRAGAQAKLERLRGEFSLLKIERRERIVSIEAAIN